MASSPRRLAGLALVLLLCMAATIMAAGGVESYSFPVFNATTTARLVAATNTYVAEPAALLFQPDLASSPGANMNVSEGFLLLPDTVDVWRAGAGAGGVLPAREASFNTSFTVEGSASPVSFVVLLDRFPLFNSPVGLRGANGSAAVPDANATNDGLAAVQVGAVRSYEPGSPEVGLNVTVTPNGNRAVVVWVEYDAAAHLLRVYVAAAWEPRPPRALLDVRLSLASRRTTQTALVGFFAATVRDVFLGVRDWDLTVDSLETGGKKKGTSWWVILIAVLGSVVATVAIVSLVACYFVSRRWARSMEPKQ